MADQKYQGQIYIKTGGKPVTVEVFAHNVLRAREIIEAKPEFKSWYIRPTTTVK